MIRSYACARVAGRIGRALQRQQSLYHETLLVRSDRTARKILGENGNCLFDFGDAQHPQQICSIRHVLRALGEIGDAKRLQLERKHVLCAWDEDGKPNVIQATREAPEDDQITHRVCARAQVEGDRIIEPVFGPAVALRDLGNGARQPIRPRLPDLRDIDVFSREAKVACQQKGGAAENRDVESRAHADGGTTKLVKRRKQLLAIECLGHPDSSWSRQMGKSRQFKSAPSPRSIATKPGKLVAMKAVSSTFTGRALASPITSADMAMR